MNAGAATARIVLGAWSIRSAPRSHRSAWAAPCGHPACGRVLGPHSSPMPRRPRFPPWASATHPLSSGIPTTTTTRTHRRGPRVEPPPVGFAPRGLRSVRSAKLPKPLDVPLNLPWSELAPVPHNRRAPTWSRCSHPGSARRWDASSTTDRTPDPRSDRPVRRAPDSLLLLFVVTPAPSERG